MQTYQFLLHLLLMKKDLKGNCASCLMPLAKDPAGVNREHELYCSYCYKNGQFCYAGSDLKGFRKAMIDAITARGESKLKAYLFAFMAGFAPRWRKAK